MAKRGRGPKTGPIAIDEDEREALAAFLKSVDAMGGFPGLGATSGEALEDAFEDFLGGGEDDEEEEEDEAAETAVTELADSLDRVRLEANGGDPLARASMRAFRARLENAITEGEIGPIKLILLGKVLWKLGLPVGASLREAVAASVGDEEPTPRGFAPLVEMAAMTIEAIEDPFDLYDELASNVAAFPVAYRVASALAVIGHRATNARTAALGYLFHPDEEVAVAALRALPIDKYFEDPLFGRLERALSWQPASRRDLARAALEKLRSRPRPKSQPKESLGDILVTGHDGSSSCSISVLVGGGRNRWLVNLLLKHSGIADVIMRDGVTKKEADQLVKLLRTTSAITALDPADLGRFVALALGRSLARGAPPPFRILAFCEAVGLGALEPDESDAATIVASLLADARVDAEMEAQAHENIFESPEVESWFEAGEETDELLCRSKTRKLALRKALAEHFPTRRPYWAMLCATSAFVLKHRKGGADPAWLSFAIVGRDIAAGVALEKIPLMTRIAERTVDMHFAER